MRLFPRPLSILPSFQPPPAALVTVPPARSLHRSPILSLEVAKHPLWVRDDYGWDVNSPD